MTIEKYTELTGITVSEADAALVNAQIKRSKAMLEAALGYSLSKSKASENHYEEAGKTESECGCDDITGPLADPDSVIGAYRLFPFNKNDKYLEVDPFTKLNKVKLVFIRSGDEPNGVTVRTFDQEEVRAHIKNGFAKYIEKCDTCSCLCNCTECVQLAVDADWLFDACLPDDLLYLWVDTITFETDCKKNIKKETLGSHTYEKFDRPAPYVLAEGIAIIKKYMGPNGTGAVTLTV